MFINTVREAKIAQQIAQQFGWERSVEYFKKEYVTNLFRGFENHTDTRVMISYINSAIRASRSNRNPRYNF